MKKAIMFLFFVCSSFGCLALFSSAVSINSPREELMKQFQSGKGSLDYVYYSPVKDENYGTRYPLVVWLHGNSSGDYPGNQLESSDISNWSSEEYQQRFKGTQGAYLLLPRCPTGGLSPVAWGVERKNALKSTIDSFVESNKDTVDTSRIYIGGYSMGGKMTVIMASSYPEYFAAAFPMSPVYGPTRGELQELGKMPVWLFVNKNDKYLSLDYNTVVKSNWKYFSSHCAFPNESRMTVFSSYFNPYGGEDASEVHNTWNAVTSDMFMKSYESYYGSETVNANGETVALSYPDGVISWLSSQCLETENSASLNFIRKIIMLIKRLISLIFVI